MNPLIEAPLCLGTLVAAVLVMCLFEATIGRWLRGRNRYTPPGPDPDPGPRSYDASGWAAWPEEET